MLFARSFTSPTTKQQYFGAWLRNTGPGHNVVDLAAYNLQVAQLFSTTNMLVRGQKIWRKKNG